MSGPTIPPVYFINLARRTDRRERLETRLQELGLTGIRIDAVTPDTIPADVMKRHQASPEDRRMTIPEVACLMSHRRALKTFLDSGAPVGVILEDDVILASRFAETTASLAADSAIGIVRLERMTPRFKVGAAKRSHGDLGALYPVRQYDWGAAAYLLTTSAARKLLDLDYPMMVPADYWVFDLGFAKPRGEALEQFVPAIAIQERLLADRCGANPDSDLEQERVKRGNLFDIPRYYIEWNPRFREFGRFAYRLHVGWRRWRAGNPVFVRTLKVDVPFADPLPGLADTLPGRDEKAPLQEATGQPHAAT
jgi:glycosyl transferase family 25